MSIATKRKHVVKEVSEELILPAANQQIVRVVEGRGNNLHMVESADGQRFLASMPTKFRRNVWIKRGDLLLVEPIEEGKRVKVEIIRPLYRAQIDHIHENGLLPAVFDYKAVVFSATPATAAATVPVSSSDGQYVPEDLLPPDTTDSDSEQLSDDSPDDEGVGDASSDLCSGDDDDDDDENWPAKTVNKLDSNYFGDQPCVVDLTSDCGSDASDLPMQKP